MDLAALQIDGELLLERARDVQFSAFERLAAAASGAEHEPMWVAGAGAGAGAGAAGQAQSTRDLAAVIARAAAARVGAADALGEELTRLPTSRWSQGPAVSSAGDHAVSDFAARTRAGEWMADLVAVHVTTGLLDDVFIRLSAALPDSVAARASAILGSEMGQTQIEALLLARSVTDETTAARLALWGRRVTGDALLLAHSSIRRGVVLTPADGRLEAVLADALDAHTRRMAALGLAA